MDAWTRVPQRGSLADNEELVALSSTLVSDAMNRSASTSARAYVARDLQNQLAELLEPGCGERPAFENSER